MPLNADAPLTPADQLLGEATNNAEEAALKVKRETFDTSRALTPKMIGKFEAAADRHGVPVDVLLGMAERDSGFNPFSKSSGHGPRVRGIINVGDDEAGKPDVNAYDVDQALDIAAAKIKRSLDSGLSIDDAIRAHGGGGAAGDAYLADVANRGKRLASAIYPAPEAPVDPDAHNVGKPGNRNVAVDVALQAAGGLNKGIGSTIRGAGAAVALLGDYTTTPILNRLFGREGGTPNALDPVADAFSEHGKRGQAAVSEQTRRAIEDSSPKGDILKPSTWTLGKAPSLVGYTALVADVFGSMAPVIAASIASGGSATAGALAGGLQGGGDAVEKARETIDAMAKKQAADNGKPGATVLEQESAFYREQIASGKTPAQALALTKQAAERAAFIFTTPVSALGGAATSKLMHPATKLAAGASLPGRVAARTAASGLEEGLQEVGESVAANVGVNTAAGTSINPTEDTFGDFILGMMGGAGTGAAGGALSKRETAPAAQQKPAPTTPGGAAAQVEQGVGDAPPAPSSLAPTPAPQPAPEAVKPAGPLSAALAAGAPNLAPIATATGSRVVVSDEMGVMAGAVVGQDAEHVIFKADDGNEHAFTHQEIADGAIKMVPEGASLNAPEAAPAISVLQKPAAPEPAKAAQGDMPATAPSPRPALPSPASRPSRAGADRAAHEPAPTPPTEKPISGRATAHAPAPHAPDRSVAEMSDAELSAKLAYVADQAKGSGWSKLLIKARNEIQTELDARKPEGPSVVRISRNDGTPFKNKPAVRLAIARLKRDVGEFDIVAEGDGFVAVPKASAPQQFAPETGTLGVPREEMPQVKSEHHGALVNNLNAQGIAHQTTTVDPETLKPSQDTFVPEKVEAAKEATGDRAVIVSSDGHVIDGHHQWLADKEAGRQTKAIVLDAPAQDAIEAIKAFPSATTAADAAPVVDDKPAPKSNALPEQKWFGTKEKAQAFIERNGLGETHAVKRDGQRFVAVEKPTPATATEQPSEGDKRTKAVRKIYNSKEFRKAKVDFATRSDHHWDAPHPESSGAHEFLSGYEDAKAGKPAATQQIYEDATYNPINLYRQGYVFGRDGRLEWKEARTANNADFNRRYGEPETPAEAKPAATTFQDVGRQNVAEAEKNIAAGKEGMAPSTGFTTEQAVVDLLTSRGWKREDTPGANKHRLTFVSPDGKGKLTATPGDQPKTPYRMVYEPVAQEAPTFPEFGSERPGVEVIRIAMPKASKLSDAGVEVKQIDGRWFVGQGFYYAEGRKTGYGASTPVEFTALTPKMGHDTREQAIQTGLRKLMDGFADDQRAVQNLGKAIESAGLLSIYQNGVAAPKPAPASEPKGKLDAAADAIDAKIKEAEDELAAIFAGMKGQLNSGIPPELVAAGVKLGTLYVAKGVVKFGQFAKAIYDALRRNGVEHDPAVAAPYIKGIYNQLKMHVDDETFAKMDDERVVRAFDVKTLSDLTEADNPALNEGNSDQTATTPNPGATSEADQKVEGYDAGPAIHGEGAEALGGVASVDDGGATRGGDAQRGSAGGEQAGGRASGGLDGKRPSKARSGRNGSSRNDPSPAGEVTAQGSLDVEPDKRTPAPINIPRVDFEITDEHEIGKGGEAAKFADNVAAIRTLKRIEAEGRRATAAEQAVLARYVGWGGLKNAFRVAGSAEGEGVAKGWEKRVAEIEELLTPDELKAARNSTAAAHYTSPAVVKAMWAAVRRMGFHGGSVLEPSAGVGNFIGLMPKDMRGASDLLAVEYDSLTARIAEQLYPNAHVIHSGFQDVPLPEGKFALAIGNPPFGRDRLHFRYNASANGKSIHNQFFIASLDAVRPGGVMAMVVSHNLMDALDNGARLEMARRAEFVAAIRLPDTAFKENARTEVVTDLMFFRKRPEAHMEASQHVINDMRQMKVPEDVKTDALFRKIKAEISGWVHSEPVDDPAGSGEKININGYFRQRPDMVIGKIDAAGTMNGRKELNVTLADPAQFEPMLSKVIERLPRLEASEQIAQASREHFDAMVTGMKLALDRAEPGQVRRTAEGDLKTVIHFTGPNNQSMLREITLTANTPFNTDYNLTIDGKWERVDDVLDEAGNKVKALDAQGKPTRLNAKKATTFEREEDIPANHQWGEDRIARLNAMLPIRNLIKRQIVLEAQDATDRMLAENRAKLNTAYDRFVSAHGNLHDAGNARIALTMPDGGLIMAAEDKAKDGTISKSPIMQRRVTIPPVPATSAKDASEAVAISLAETGRIDLARVASLLGVDEKGAEAAIGDGEKPSAFYDPEAERWESADLYLSGLVRKKLNAARAARLDQNIKALEAVIPADWDASQIVPNLGSAWVPPDIYSDFLKHVGYQKSHVGYSPVTNSFSVSFSGSPSPQWATTGGALDTGTIISRLLNSQAIKVVREDSDGKKYVDEAATTESQQKAGEIFNEFLDWAFADDTRRERMVREFNDRFNTRVVRQRDGSHLTLPGKVPDSIIKMRRHQKNAIWRGITDRAVLYDHVVGAGKTYTAIARIMERRRMGLTNKGLVVVPNHLVEQWGEDTLKLYPGAKVLAAGKKDFESENRRRLFAKIATGDYDLIIIGHSSFGFIELDRATEESYLNEELAIARKAAEEAAQDAAENGFSGRGKPLGVKEAERLVNKIEARLNRLRDGKKRDRLLTFNELGVDDLTIDEAHEFKNLAYTSRLTGVSGMGNKSGSQKAMDLHMKLRSMHDRGASMAFLTGTPISNSVAEMYLVLRNLVPNEMREMGIENFDAWRAMFVSYSSAYEPTEAGGIKEVTRLGREWMNMRSLMDLYYSVSDAVTIDDIKEAYAQDNPGKKFPIPDVASKRAGKGDREMVAIKPTPEQRAVLGEIVAGFNELPFIQDLKVRNAARLRLMDRARKISLDPRADDPMASVSSTGGKIGAVVDRAAAIHKKWAKDRGTQLIFLDRSVPKSKGDEKIVADYDRLRAKLRDAVADGDEEAEAKIVSDLERFDTNEIASLRAAIQGGWNAYDEIKRQLVARGVPEKEIRYVQEASTDLQKAALFAQVRSGDVRILIGSTPRMGAGTNVQDRLVAEHHVDVTWKPSDIEQREGRIIRQGNLLLEKYGDDFAVEVIAYATEMTVDAKMWSLNATKLKAINGIRKYDGSFQMEFEDEESASMAEMAALATGNPLMVERVTLSGDIGKLEMQERSYNRRKSAMRDRLAQAKRTIETAPAKAQRYNDFADEIVAGEKEMAKRERSITVAGKKFTDQRGAMNAADAEIERMRGDDEKARFSIDVGGQKLTSVAAIEKAVREAIGTEDFEATVDGKSFIVSHDAAQAIAGKAAQAKANSQNADYAIEGVTLNGLPVNVVVEPYGRTNQVAITFGALNAHGQVMTETTSIGSEVSAPIVRYGLEKLAGYYHPDYFRRTAKNILADAESAKKELPGLAGEIEKAWPKAEELEAKRARLQGVTAELAGKTDADRLGRAEGEEHAAKASVANGDADGMTGAALKAALASGVDGDAVSRLMASGAIIVHDSAADLPGKNHPENVAGMVAGDGKVRLVAGALDPSTARAVLLHEMIHAGTQPLVGQRVWQETLERATTAATRAAERGDAGSFWTEAMRRAASAPEAHRAEEIAAYAAEAAEAAPVGLAEMARRLVGLFQATLLRRFGTQIGAVTPQQMRALAIGALRSWNGVPRIIERGGVRYAVTEPGAPRGRGRLEEARATLSDYLSSVMVGTKGSADSVGKMSALGLIPTRPLFLELAKGIPAASRYIDYKQNMDAERNRWLDVADKTLQKWARFANANKDANTALMDMMHETTLAQVDPSKPPHKDMTPEERIAWGDAKAKFDALPETAKELYGEVRDAYGAMADESEGHVIANIQKALDIMLRRAERDHEDELRRIADDGLTGKEREAAIEAADNRLKHMQTRTRRNRVARMKRLRADFEANRLKGPYFPLARFGHYFVTIRDKEGKVLSFSRFESKREQRKFVESFDGDETVSIEVGVASAKTDMEKALDPKFVSDVDALLEGAGTPDSVRDQIWQRYLETLPDFSMRKSRIHRKGRAGFNRDAFRAFAHHMFHGTHQLMRLRFGADLQEQINDAELQARRAPDPVRAGALVNEMKLRHNFIMNPVSSPWAHRLTTFTFIWTMGANLSSALVNLDQSVTKGIPVLSFDEEVGVGVKQGAAQLLAAMRDFTFGKGSVEGSDNLTEDERAAMRAGYETGVIDKTQAHDVAGIAEAGVNYNATRQTIMRVLSWPMHQTERFNREVTFLAAYRIARSKGLDHARAVRKARDMTYMTHYDNQSTSKPRFMQGDVSRVMFALKAFQANLLFRVFRDFHQSIKGETAEARNVAMGRLATTLILTGIAAGVRGAPAVSVIMGIAGLFMALGGNDDDPEEVLRRAILSTTGDTIIGRAVGGMIVDGVPGYLTGTSLSQRVGMGDLWFRSNDRDMTAKQTFDYWTEQMLGASYGLVKQIVMGGAQFGENPLRAIEAMSPAALKNLMKAGRYAVEGARNKDGDEIVENVPAQDVIKQAIGFTPAEIAERNARSNYQMNQQRRILADRKEAMRDAVKARGSDDRATFDAAQEKIDAFNAAHPDLPIKPKNVRQSARAIEARKERREYGIDLNPKLAPAIKDRTSPTIYERE